MRVILEQGDKPEVKSLIYCLQKCGLDFVIVEDKAQQVHRLPSDEGFKIAIRCVLPSFTVGTQWVAVYRILVDYYCFPKPYDVFCTKIGKLMKGVKLPFPCNYQSIQKPLAQYAILQKPYSEWKKYSTKVDERFFSRQKRIADKLFEVLCDS